MVVRLGALPSDPYDIPLANGVNLTVRPLETAVYEAAKFYSYERVMDAVNARETGKPGPENFDLSTPAGRYGFEQALFAEALGIHGIIAWDGVVVADPNCTEDIPEDDKPTVPAEVTPQNIIKLMRDHASCEDFIVKYTAAHAALDAEGKD
jgi:hypothetical protein